MTLDSFIQWLSRWIDKIIDQCNNKGEGGIVVIGLAFVPPPHSENPTLLLSAFTSSRNLDGLMMWEPPGKEQTENKKLGTGRGA